MRTNLARAIFGTSVQIVCLFALLLSGNVVAQIASGQDGKTQLVRTDSGLPIKLVIIKNDAVYKDKDGKDNPIAAFNFYWLLEPKEGKDGSYRFGTNDGLEIGWIKKEYVTQWKTAFCFDPDIPKLAGSDRYFAVVNGETKAEEARFISSAAGHKALALITDSIDGKPVSDPDMEFVKVVVFLGELLSDQPQSQDIKKLGLEIVYVIDTTGSMMPLINVVKDVVREAAKALAAHTDIKDRIRFGLVEFRDDGIDDGFPNGKSTRVACKLTSDFTVFQNALNGLKAERGGDIPEEVFVGLRTAIEDAGWQEDNNSTKHIFLFGDAPAKGKGEILSGRPIEGVSGLSRKDVIALAHPQRTGSDDVIAKNAKHIHCILAWGGLNEGGATSGLAIETRLAREQFQELARNGGKATHNQGQGFYVELDTTNNASKANATAKLNNFSQDFAFLKNPDAKTAKPEDSVIIASIYEILNSSVSLEYLKITPGYEGVAKGRDKNNHKVANAKVMILRSQSRVVSGNLGIVYSILKGKIQQRDRQDAGTLLEELNRALALANTGTKVDAHTNLADVFMKDFPLKFELANRFSVAQIAVLDERNFNALLERLENTIKYLDDLEKKEETWQRLEMPGGFRRPDGTGEFFQFVPWHATTQ